MTAARRRARLSVKTAARGKHSALLIRFNRRACDTRIAVPDRSKFVVVGLVVLLCELFAWCGVVRSQISYDMGQDTVFAHSETSPFWISGQGNFIFQWHPRFAAQYSGPHSFERVSEQAASEVLTLYTGLELSRTTEALVDVESAGGSGLSQVLGMAGFPNAAAVRSPSLDETPYLPSFIR